ncbi:tetratricopeptide repeat protein [Halocola ammonii]
MKLTILSIRPLLVGLSFLFSIGIFAQDTTTSLSELQALYEQEQYEACLEGLEKTLEEEQSAEALRLQADCYHKLGALNEALPSYNEALEKESKNATALLHRGICYYGLGDLDAASRDLEECMKLDPDNAMIYYYQAEIDYEKFEQESAIQKLGVAIDLDENYMEAYYLRAAAASEIGNYELAITDYKKALKLKPEFRRTALNLALVYMDQGDFEVALEKLKQLTLEVIDFKAEVFYYTAEAKLSLNDKEGACQALSEASALGDKEAEKAYKSICKKNKEKMPERRRTRAAF